jgi:hypothetical protein
MAMGKSFMLIGRHGTGKTRIAKILSRGYGEKGFVFYDATKEDLISIAGIPDPDGLKSGKLRFVGHERSIWGKSTVVVDEITRAGKESQNLWLEILEERTCFGLPLAYRTLIATANPESYAAAFKLDDALLDRFHAVIPVPEMQRDVTRADVEQLVAMALDDGQGPTPEEIARAFVEIQNAHSSLVKGGARRTVQSYLSILVPDLLRLLKDHHGPFVSPRTYARNLPESMLAIAAYGTVIGVERPLSFGAVQALRYALSTKLQIKPSLLEQLHKAADPALGGREAVPSDRLRHELNQFTAFDDRLEFVRKRWPDLQTALAADEIEKIMGDLLRGASKQGDQEKLVILRRTLDELQYKGDAVRQVDGRLLVMLNSAINYVMPRLSKLTARDRPSPEAQAAIDNIRRFQSMVASGSFFSERTEGVERLKTFLIDVYEDQQPTDEQHLIQLFKDLNLGSAWTRPSGQE